MLKKHKNILYSLIAIIILFFGYWYFVLSKKDTNSSSGNSTLVAKNPATATTGSSATTQKTYNKEFVASLQAIQYITLDTTVLETPAYKALSFPEVPFQVDYNIPVGRRNPFLPIDSDFSPVTSDVDLLIQPEPVNTVSTTTQAPATTTLPNPKKR